LIDKNINEYNIIIAELIFIFLANIIRK